MAKNRLHWFDIYIDVKVEINKWFGKWKWIAIETVLKKSCRPGFCHHKNKTGTIRTHREKI